MNLLKSLFISSYMTMLMVFIGYSGWMIYQGGDPIGWIGVLLTAGPIMMVISWLMMLKSVARTSAHFPVLNLLALIGAGLSGWDKFALKGATLPFALAVAGWVGLVLYSYWYSSFGGRKQNAKLKVGFSLPKFTVKGANGAAVTSDELTSGPAILIFFRGNWCPLCMAQVKELVGRYKEISALGVRVALISPQPHTNTQALAKKFGVRFDFLTDEGAVAARALGINQDHGLPMGMQMMGYDSETVLPTVIITDRNGKVVWKHETDNYRIRPEPDTYLNVLRTQGLVPAE